MRGRGVEREVHGPRGPALQVPWADECDPRAHSRKGQSNALCLGSLSPFSWTAFYTGALGPLKIITSDCMLSK